MTTAAALDAFVDLAEELAGRGVHRSQMFGKQSLNHGSKAFACLLRESLAFKLGAGTAEHTEALAIEGARLFDPSGDGRPMKDWVAVPVSQVDAWRKLADAAVTRVG